MSGSSAETAVDAMVIECLELSKNCTYTSTSLYIRLRWLRTLRIGFQVAPLILGSLAGWSLLTKSDSDPARLGVALMAFLAGLLPAIYRALKLDSALAKCSRLAAEFKSLQDGFRQCARIDSKKSPSEFEARFNKLMRRRRRARSKLHGAGTVLLVGGAQSEAWRLLGGPR